MCPPFLESKLRSLACTIQVAVATIIEALSVYQPLEEIVCIAGLYYPVLRESGAFHTSWREYQQRLVRCLATFHEEETGTS